MEEISKELAEIEQQVAAGTLDPNAAAEKSAAIMEKHMAEFGAAQSRITSEEAKNIDQLGAQLKAKQDDPQNWLFRNLRKNNRLRQRRIPKSRTRRS